MNFLMKYLKNSLLECVACNSHLKDFVYFLINFKLELIDMDGDGDIVIWRGSNRRNILRVSGVSKG